MTKTSESGHSKNVANFGDLTSVVKGYGEKFNPTREALKLLALLVVLTNSKKAIEAVNAALPAYTRAVAARETAFMPLSKLITRIMNSLKSLASTDHIHENALTFARKIQGKRATAKRTEEQIKADVDAGKELIEKSASQMSYDSRLDNLDKLIKFLSSVVEYAPNEADLKVESLSSLYADLMLKNTAVKTAANPLSNARISRDEVLYKADTGLVDIALSTKAYIKSIYGASSPQYKQVSKLKFKNG
jgi:hypothetical protein